MRIIISGSREFNNYEIIENKILDIIGKNSNNNIEIISGGCRGVDKCAEMFAYRNGYEFTEFPADWSLGKRAGYLRNKQMAEYASELNGVLIAFWNMKNKGTKMMIDLARRYGLDVYIINLLDMKIYR